MTTGRRHVQLRQGGTGATVYAASIARNVGLPSISTGEDTRSAWARGEQWFIDNTGVQAGVSLTSSGSITTTAANQLIENKTLAGGSIYIRHGGVTVRNCRFTGSGGNAFDLSFTGTTATIEHCEVSGTYSNALVHNGGPEMFTVRWLKAAGMVQDGIKLSAGSHVLDCYMHSFTYDPASHTDGVQHSGGMTASAVRRSWIDVADVGGAATSPVFIKCEGTLGWGDIANVTIDGNYCNGGSYSIFLDGHDSAGGTTVSDIVCTNNVVGPDNIYGYVNVDTVSNLTWTNNTRTDGTPVSY